MSERLGLTLPRRVRATPVWRCASVAISLRPLAAAQRERMARERSGSEPRIRSRWRQTPWLSRRAASSRLDARSHPCAPVFCTRFCIRASPQRHLNDVIDATSGDTGWCVLLPRVETNRTGRDDKWRPGPLVSGDDKWRPDPLVSGEHCRRRPRLSRSASRGSDRLSRRRSWISTRRRRTRGQAGKPVLHQRQVETWPSAMLERTVSIFLLRQ